eukprot:PhM_4_TR18015/c0_g1_i4/m.33336
MRGRALPSTLAFAALLEGALRKLPLVAVAAKRGVRVGESAALRALFAGAEGKAGSELAWPQFTSFTLEDGVAMSFAGDVGDAIVFLLGEGKEALIDIHAYSARGAEAELVALPGQKFRVANRFPVGRIAMVVLTPLDDVAVGELAATLEAVRGDGTKAGQLLCDAAKDGKAELVGAMLQLGFSTDLRDGDDNTPLMQASWFEHMAVVQLLLEHGAAVDALGLKRNWTALMSAACCGETE